MMIRSVDPLQHTSMYQRAEEGLYMFISSAILPFHRKLLFFDFPNFFLDSEDSDGEGGLGNVSRVIIRPPGHSGKGNVNFISFVLR